MENWASNPFSCDFQLFQAFGFPESEKIRCWAFVLDYTDLSSALVPIVSVQLDQLQAPWLLRFLGANLYGLSIEEH